MRLAATALACLVAAGAAISAIVVAGSGRSVMLQSSKSRVKRN